MWNKMDQSASSLTIAALAVFFVLSMLFLVVRRLVHKPRRVVLGSVVGNILQRPQDMPKIQK